MTRSEEAFQRAVREIGCICCRLFLGAYSPASIHHILSAANRRMGERFVLPLCYFHHQGGGNNEMYVSRHPWKSEFVLRYGTELELLEQTKRLVAQTV